MRLRLIRSSRELCEIAEDWACLCDQDPSATPFQRPQWLIPWWQHFGSGQLCAVTAMDGDALLGLLPVFWLEWKGRRQLTFLGNGISDSLNVIARPGWGEQVCAEALQLLKSEPWECWDLSDIPEGSPLAGRSAAHLYSHFVISLPDSAEAFRASLPHGLSRNLRRYGRQFESASELRFEQCSGSRMLSLLPTVFDLYARRRSELDGGNLFDQGQMMPFQMEAAARLDSEGYAALNLLWAGSRMAAANYVFRCGRTVSAYMSAFAPEFERFSPGMLVLAFSIEQAIRSGAATFDFLRGDEPYKRLWGAQHKKLYRLRLDRPVVK